MVDKYYDKLTTKTLIENNWKIEKELLSTEKDYSEIHAYKYQMFAHLENEMTKFSGGYGHQFDGNSILVYIICNEQDGCNAYKSYLDRKYCL